MAPIRSRFIQTVMNEYTKAIDLGFDAYKSIALQTAPSAEHIYKLSGTYLTQHVCIQVALYKVNPVILLYRAEDSMMKLNDECNFKSPCIMEKIRDEKSVRTRIPFMKLTSHERSTNIDILRYFQ